VGNVTLSSSTITQSGPRTTAEDSALHPVPYRTAVVLGLLAGVLATLGSWIPSLWGDEAASLLSAERPIPSLFSMLGNVDAVHGTYYLMMHFWVDLVGYTPFTFRLPSAVAVAVTVAGVVILAHRLAGYRTAIVAGLVCMILPRVTYMGEEARSYAFSAAFAVWLTIILVRLIGRGETRKTRWLLYTIVLAASGYMFLFGLLMIASHAVAVWSARPGRRVTMTWLLSTIVGVLLASPVGIWGFIERKQIAYLQTSDAVNVKVIAVDQWFGNTTLAILSWSIILISVIAAVIAMVRIRRNALSVEATVLRRQSGGDPSLFAVAISWLVLPVVLLLCMNLASAVYTVRYLSFASPAAALLIALAVTTPPALGMKRWIAPVAVVLVVAAALPSYASQRTPYAKNNSDWAAQAAVLQANARPGDAVLFDEDAHPSKRPRLAKYTYPAAFRGLKDIALKTPYSKSATWYDTVYPLTSVENRLDTVKTVWMLEYRAPGGTMDDYDLQTLKSLGFAIAKEFPEHASVVLELVRQ
jgi:mannosyltransferase